VAVFILDAFTPLGIEVWVLNLPVILIPVIFRSTRTVVYLSLACSAMVLVDFIVSAPGPHPASWDMLNRMMGLATIWVIAVLAATIIQTSIKLDDALSRLRREITEHAQTSRALEIGQELHDGVGQELTGLGLMAQSLAQRLPESAAEKRIALRLTAGLDTVHQQVRELSHGLIPVHLESGLSAALEDLAARTTAASGISVTAQCPEWVELRDHATAMQLFRIAQEAVSNALRHGQPRHIRLTLLTESKGLRLCIEDDGTGIHPLGNESDGVGLRIMQYRARTVGADLQISPSRGGGTVVTCTLPRSNGNDQEEPGSGPGQDQGLDRG
jgi:signal transduction histidine kinase